MCDSKGYLNGHNVTKCDRTTVSYIILKSNARTSRLNCALPRQVLTAVNVQYAAMARYQDSDGAFRMWPESEPSVWLTAYILRTLWLASFQVCAHSGRRNDVALKEGSFCNCRPSSLWLSFLFPLQSLSSFLPISLPWL